MSSWGLWGLDDRTAGIEDSRGPVMYWTKHDVPLEALSLHQKATQTHRWGLHTAAEGKREPFNPLDDYYFPGYDYGSGYGGEIDDDDATQVDMANSWLIGEGSTRRKPHLQRGVEQGPAHPDAPLTDTERWLQNTGHEFAKRIHQAEPNPDHIYRGMAVPPEWIEKARQDGSITLPLSSFSPYAFMAHDYSRPDPDRGWAARKGHGVILKVEPGSKSHPINDDENVSHGDFDVLGMHQLTDDESVNEYEEEPDGIPRTVIHVRQRSVPAPVNPTHTASTDGIRYAHIVEADVAEDLRRLAMAWDQWAPQVQGGCEHGCDHSRMTMGEYSIQHPFGRSALQFTHDTAPDGTPELYISGVHTNEGHRRSGVAEALMRRLHDDHPGTRINPGYMTDMGQGLKDGLVGRIPGVKDVLAGKNGDLPPLTFEPFNTMWSNGIMARHAEDGRPVGHLHWVPRGEIDSIVVHPELQRRGIGTAMLEHARAHPDQYPSTYPIFHSQNLTKAGRAWAAKDGHTLPDEQVYAADDDPANWGFTAVNQYVPLSERYSGQNEDEMSRYLEQPWIPPKTASTGGDDGWPVWWRGKRRPAGDFDERWSPNHPQRVPAPWES